MINLTTPRADGDPRSTATIKGWVRDALALDEGVTVMVTELRCSEPGCPPLETVIAILGQGTTRQHKLPLGLAAVTPEDIQGIARAEALRASRPAPTPASGNDDVG